MWKFTEKSPEQQSQIRTTITDFFIILLLKLAKKQEKENVLLVHQQDGTVKVLQSKFLRITGTCKAIPDSINNLLHLRILLFLCCLTSTTYNHNQPQHAQHCYRRRKQSMTKWKKLCGSQKLVWQNGSNPNFRLPLSLISASVSSSSIPCNVIRLKLSLQTLKSFEEFWNEFEMGSCNLSSKTELQNLKSFDMSLKWVLAISDQNLTANSEEF